MFYTPCEIIRKVNSLINSDDELGGIVIVRGEISGFKIHGAHAYFSIKDEKTSLKAVFFSIPLAVKKNIKDGMLVDIAGNLKIYEARGDFQIYVRQINILNKIGMLQVEFEKLKEKLSAQLIIPKPNNERKIIPEFPNSIAIVASRTSAAYKDVLKTLYLRYPVAKLNLYHSSVQGTAAPNELLNAIHDADNSECDVVLIVRGGGSIEDLWCFNNEEVVRKIRYMKKPVIVGVGHETDHTLSEYACDQSASTPTAAAMQCSINIFDVLQVLKVNLKNKRYNINQKIGLMNIKIQNVFKTINAIHPYNIVQKLEEDYKGKLHNLSKTVQNKLDRHIDIMSNIKSSLKKTKLREQIYALSQRNEYCMQHLNAINPDNILKKGYILAYKEDKLVKSIKEIYKDNELQLKFHDGKTQVKVMKIFNDSLKE